MSILCIFLDLSGLSYKFRKFENTFVFVNIIKFKKKKISKTSRGILSFILKI